MHFAQGEFSSNDLLGDTFVSERVPAQVLLLLHPDLHDHYHSVSELRILMDNQLGKGLPSPPRPFLGHHLHPLPNCVV